MLFFCAAFLLSEKKSASPPSPSFLAGWVVTGKGTGNALSFLRKESCAKKGMDGLVQRGIADL